jgi:hypothetical protein
MTTKCSSTPALVGLSSKPLARRVVHCRYRDRFDIGRRRNRHDGHTGLGGSRCASRSGCLRFRLGRAKGSGICSPQDRYQHSQSAMFLGRASAAFIRGLADA